MFLQMICEIDPFTIAVDVHMHLSMAHCSQIFHY